MSRRRLRQDELDLWQQVAKSTERLPGRKASVQNQAKTKPLPTEAKPVEPISRFDLGQRALPKMETHDFSGTTAERLSRDTVRMDAKAFTKMKRGKLVPEARIDLHGMTVEQAHPALAGFILNAQARGLRLVLVITGKGSREDPHDPMPRRRGVLKTQVPQWLRLAPVSRAVLQVSEAHLRHGGSGAYYVYLRRLR